MPLPADYPADAEDDLALVELVNRVLDKGAVISGDVVISVAGIDLVYVGLRVVLASVESMIARENALPRENAPTRENTMSRRDSPR